MITYKLLTNTGGRDRNEDSCGMLEKDGMYLFTVADGLGGHGKGEVASALAVEAALTCFADEPHAETVLSDVFFLGQENILRRQEEENLQSEMKTTMVALLTDGDFAQWAYIGDSRCYHFVHHRLKERTLDHSVPQMLVAAHEIKEKEIRHHPDRNRLLRVMGMPWEEPKFAVSEKISLNKRKREAFLLCSDGFWELIEEKQMVSCLKEALTAEDWIERMERVVLANGSGTEMDNYTALGVFIEGK